MTYHPTDADKLLIIIVGIAQMIVFDCIAIDIIIGWNRVKMFFDSESTKMLRKLEE